VYDRKRLGALLRRERLRKGLTYKQVGDALGLYLTYVSSVEKGKSSISPERLDQLVSVLSLSAEAEREVFQVRGCLPPHVVAHFMNQPWPERVA